MSAPTDLRYDCNRQGCFNVKQRLKFKIFADCFKYGINFTDIDGCVERNGHLLWLEWKSSGVPLGYAQRTMFVAQCSGKPHHKVFIVWGDAETMIPEQVQVIDNFGGVSQRDCMLEELQQMISDWFAKADDVTAFIKQVG